MYSEITTDGVLDDLVTEAIAEGIYALDTEFHRESTYFPQVALLQFSVADTTYLVDPLEVDLTRLRPLMQSDATCVMHAGAQDLEILKLETGECPRVFIDTQLMAGFVGMSTPSLAALHKKYFNVDLPKASRLTDWLKRPLTENQKVYAASDVDRLLELYQQMRKELEQAGRYPWAVQESEGLAEKYRSDEPKKDPILRIKEARSLKGRARHLAGELADWREQTARSRNVPVRRVLGDLALSAIAQKAPSNEKALVGIRGVDRSLSNRDKSEIVNVVAKANSEPLPEPSTAPKPDSVSPELKPAIALISAVLTQTARNHDLDPMLLSTRADLEAFVAGDTSAKLANGWRYEMAGDQISKLLAGSACVAFEKGSGLLMEPRKSQDL